MQETGLGGVREGKRQDFPAGPAHGKWRTKGSVDAARRPRPQARRQTVGRALKGRYASTAAGC